MNEVQRSGARVFVQRCEVRAVRMFPLFVRVFFTKLRNKSRSSDRLRLQFVAHAQSRFRPNPFRRDISALVASLARDLAVLVCAVELEKPFVSVQ